MKSDRLVVLMAPEEKARIVDLARARQTSVGELVRTALTTFAETPASQAPPARAAGTGAGRSSADDDEGHEMAPPDAPRLSADQVAALERLADVALATMQRADAALDRAFEEVEATKAHFAAKRAAGTASSAVGTAPSRTGTTP